MRLKRVSWLAAGVATILIGATACTASEPAGGDVDEPQTITVWAWAEAANAIKTEVKDEFEAKYPNITVNLVELGAWELMDKLLASLAGGGELPDVAEVVRRVYPRYMASGQMLDLSALAGDQIDGFSGSSIAELSYDGKLYGLPTETSYSVFAYNKAIFEEHGIDPASLKTWDDVAAAAAKLAAAGIKICTQNVPSNGAPGAMLWNMFLQSAGGNLFNEDGTVVENNATAKKVFEWYLSMKDYCFQAPMYDASVWQQVEAGTLAGMWTDSTGLGQLKTNVPDQSGEWGLIPWPQFDATTDPVIGRWGGSAFTIPAASEKQDAAWKFVEFITTDPEAIESMYRVGNLITSQTSSWSEEFLREPDPYFGVSYLDILDGYDLSQPYYWGNDWLKTQDVLTVGLDDAFAGSQSPADAWAGIEDQLADIGK